MIALFQVAKFWLISKFIVEALTKLTAIVLVLYEVHLSKILLADTYNIAEPHPAKTLIAMHEHMYPVLDGI